MTDKTTHDAAGLLGCPNPWCEAAKREGDYSPAIRLHHFGNYRVVCTSCMMEGPLRPTKEEAAGAWNTRSQVPPEPSPNLTAQIARLLAADPVCGGRVASGTIEAIAIASIDAGLAMGAEIAREGGLKIILDWLEWLPKRAREGLSLHHLHTLAKRLKGSSHD